MVQGVPLTQPIILTITSTCNMFSLRRSLLRSAPVSRRSPVLSALRSTHQARFYASKKEQPRLAKYPGAENASFSDKLQFRDGSEHIFPIYHITDANGNIVNKKDYEEVMKHLSNDQVKAIYKQMVQLETMDFTLYNAQRQGRLSFYMTNFGEEATHFGIASALDKADEVFAQYREAGVLLYRGFTIQDCLAQCLGTDKDPSKGRQMPIHYGSKDLHFQTISSPLATQIPHASGAGYALKRENKKNVAVAFFGDGSASEGDFHAALNIAATLKSQTLFFCRNNGYAISTPVSDQYKGDGIAARGPGYGIPTIRVDGNDLFAVFLAVKRGREMCFEKETPVLFEFMSYRVGHHSTSDDSSRYREQEEIDFWQREHSPISRLRKYLLNLDLISEEEEAQLREDIKKQVLDELLEAEKAPKCPKDELVADVYDHIPAHLLEQKDFVDRIAEKYPEAYEDAH